MVTFLAAQCMCLNNKEVQDDHLSDTKATVKLIFLVKNTALSSYECKNRKLFETVRVNGISEDSHYSLVQKK